MDAKHFDTLARALSEAGTRRGLLGLLATLPVLGGVFALLDRDETDAKGRRKRRKKKHKHGKGRRRKHHKKCQADSKAKTCAGKCGSVINNCKKTVDCGSCDCAESCDICFICQSGPNTPGACVVDPDQRDETCGAPGQVCQADGSCACDAGSCPSGQHCVGSSCVCDGTSCPTGCCGAAGACHIDDDAACGTGGGTCIPCSGPGQTCGGGGTPGVCGCTNSTCPGGANCGSVPNVCGGTVSCGGACPQPGQPCVNNICGPCVPDCAGKVCGADDGCGSPCASGSCPSGQICVSNGTCALSCSSDPDICAPIGDGCACRTANTGQDVCMDIDFSACRCVSDCGLCVSGEVCDPGASGQCPSSPKCCPACGVT